MTEDVGAVDIRLADLQRALEVGFTGTTGQLNGLMQRVDQQDRVWSDYQRRMEQELARRDDERVRDQKTYEKQAQDHESRLRRLEFRVYAACGAAMMVSPLLAHFLR